jgi:di/tricarboxylate transporter
MALKAGHGDTLYERQDTIDIAQQALGRLLSPGEVSAYWRNRALSFIKNHPKAWLGLLWKKWLLTWNVRELEDTDDFYVYQEWSPLLRQLGLFHFGILAPLAAFGVVVTASRRKELWPLYLMIATLALSLTVFYVFGRYRFSLVPLLILFASAGIVALPALAFLVPSAITRNAILIPAYREALDSMGIAKSGRVGRALMLALGMLNPLASSALLTGGIASIAAATLLGGFSWLRWFALMAVPYYALIFLGGLYLRLMVGPFERGDAVDRPPPSPAVPLSPAETKTLVVLALTAMLWLTDAWHHLSPAIPALMAAIVLLAPRIGALSWKTFEAKLSWGLILTVGASMSLARSMIDSGAAAWLGNLFVTQLTALTVAPPVVVVLIVVAVALVHLAITNLAACMALLIPIAVTVAEAAHLNPLVCGLVVTIAVDAIILYPVQTAANLLAYEAGYFHTADVRRLGMGMLVLTIVVALLVLPYWGLLALPLAQP